MTFLLIGIALAATLFASLLWSLFRTFTGSGATRLAHGAVVVGIITVMAALTAGWPMAARGVGAGLAIAGVAAVFTDAGWSRLLPLFAVAFGLIVLRGLPFGAG